MASVWRAAIIISRAQHVLLDLSCSRIVATRHATRRSIRMAFGATTSTGRVSGAAATLNACRADVKETFAAKNL